MTPTLTLSTLPRGALQPWPHSRAKPGQQPESGCQLPSGNLGLYDASRDDRLPQLGGTFRNSIPAARCLTAGHPVEEIPQPVLAPATPQRPHEVTDILLEIQPGLRKTPCQSCRSLRSLLTT